MGEHCRTGNTEIPTAVVEEDGDGLASPMGCDDDIEIAIGVHVDGRDFDPAGRRCNTETLPRAVAQMKGDPIEGVLRIALTSFHVGEIGLLVTVKIANGELSRKRCGKGFLEVRRCGKSIRAGKGKDA